MQAESSSNMEGEDHASRTYAPGGWGILAYGLTGLVVTPVLAMLLGLALFGYRDTWGVGQGDSFMVFIVALFSAPGGAVYWAVIATTWRTLLPDVRPRVVLPVALVIYLIGLVLALLGTDASFA